MLRVVAGFIAKGESWLLHFVLRRDAKSISNLLRKEIRITRPQNVTRSAKHNQYLLELETKKLF